MQRPRPGAAPQGAAGGTPAPADSRPAAGSVPLTREECRPAGRTMVRASALLTGADRDRLAAVRGNMRPAFVVDFCDGRGGVLALEDTLVPAGSIVQRTRTGLVRVIAGCRGG